MNIAGASNVYMAAMHLDWGKRLAHRGTCGNCVGSIVGRGLLIAIICVVAVRPVHGQSETATLSGIVVDESGAALPDVQVIAANAATGLQRQTMSDADGSFSMRMLPAGSYSVTAERAGFAPAQVKDLLLSANGEVTITLELKVGEVQRGRVGAGAGRPGGERGALDDRGIAARGPERRGRRREHLPRAADACRAWPR